MAHGVRLHVAYDGTEFAGWQIQPAQRTVQEELARAIEQMTRHPVKVRGASRTDAGVHADGQVAAFDSEREIPFDGWRKGLNKYLPRDIAVKHAEPVGVGYDPRYDATEKLYRYLIEVGQARDPLRRDRAWYVAPGFLAPGLRTARRAADAFDLTAMNAAAAELIGTHDFCAFQASNDERDETVRTLSEVSLHVGYGNEPRLLALEVRGNAFLKNMVRIIAGTLVEVGRRRMTPEHVRALLHPEADRPDAGPTAPGRGLTLIQIKLGRIPT